MIKDSLTDTGKYDRRFHGWLKGLTKIIVEQFPLKKRE